MVRAVAAHAIPGRAPLRVRPGDRVGVGARSPMWPAFVLVTTGGGEGWVPERLLDAARPVASVRAAYDTQELAVAAGDRLTVLRDDPESGWSWCRDAGGGEGWLPHAALRTDPVSIRPGSPLDADVVALLAEHLADMRRTSPPESVHALEPAALAASDVVLLQARDASGALLGVGALKILSEGQGEIKSMRTGLPARGRGVGAAVLGALLDRARVAGMRRVCLETGSQAFFEPALRLYERHGFVRTGPFGAYTDDPNSRYLALDLP